MIYDSFVDFYTLHATGGFFTSDSLFVYLLSEIPNLIFCSLIVAIFFFYKKININELIIWIFLFILAFFVNLFINYVPGYFPDVGGYLRCVRDLRDNLHFDEIGCQIIFSSANEESLSFLSMKRGLPAIIFSFIPMPSIATHAAIGMINKLLTFFLYLFLKPYLQIKHSYLILCILALLPTYLLYSSIGLRDNLIFVVMAFLLFFIIQKRFFLSAIGLLILLGIKSQNGIIFLVPFLGVFIFNANQSFKGLILLISALFFGLLLIQDEVVATINFFVISFVYENQGVEVLQSLEGYQSIYSILLNAPFEFLAGLIKPLPTSATTSLFFLDSIAQLLLILYLIYKNNNLFLKSPEFFLVFITFFMGVTLNSMVIDNDGTFVRYKYAFFYCFLLYLICMNKAKLYFFQQKLKMNEK